MIRALLRVDASAEIGLGHLVRTAALANALERRRISTRFVTATAEADRWLSERGFTSERIHVPTGSDADATRSSEVAQDLGADLVVVDGYHFDARFIGRIDSRARVLVIDDLARDEQLDCAFVVNQNLYGEEVEYRTTADCLLGPAYALLRPELAEARRPIADDARRVVVMMGGSDVARLTPRVLRALSTVRPSLELRAVIGPLAQVPDETFGATIVRNPTGVEHFAWADVIVAAAGVVCLEGSCAGVPLVLVDVAENQRRVSLAAEARGLGRRLGWHEDLRDDALAREVASLLADSAARREMNARQLATVDGSGADRVVEHVLKRTA